MSRLLTISATLFQRNAILAKAEALCKRCLFYLLVTLQIQLFSARSSFSFYTRLAIVCSSDVHLSLKSAPMDQLSFSALRNIYPGLLLAIINWRRIPAKR